MVLSILTFLALGLMLASFTHLGRKSSWVPDSLGFALLLFHVRACVHVFEW